MSDTANDPAEGALSEVEGFLVQLDAIIAALDEAGHLVAAAHVQAARCALESQD